MTTISRAGYSALVDYQYRHKDQMGGVALSGAVVTVAVVGGLTESRTATDVQALVDTHAPADADGEYSVETIVVERSYGALYAIMYVLPAALDLDVAQTRVHCYVDVLGNRVQAGLDPFTAEIAARAGELWGSKVAVGPLPADFPRLVARPRRTRRSRAAPGSAQPDHHSG